MPLRSMIAALAAESDLAVVLTDGSLEPPGPKILYVNSAFERLCGYRADELIGRNPRVLQGPATSLAGRKRLAQGLRTALSCRVTLTNYRKSGEAYRCEIRLFPIALPGGGLLGAVAIERELPKHAGRRPSKGAG